MSDPWVLPQASPAFGGSPEPATPAVGSIPTAPPDGEERFPHGAEAGWRPDPTVPGMLRLWDGRHWTEHTRPLDPAADAIAKAPAIRNNNGVRAWALMAQLTLGLWVAVSCVQMLWSIATFNTLQIWSLQPGDLHETEARRILQTMILILCAQLLVHFVSVVFLLVWVGVARNDRHINPRLLRGSTGAAVVGWLIPFLRVRVSRRTLSDLWHGSDPVRADHGPKTASRATPPLVLAYLLLRFAAPVVAILVVNRARDALGTVDRLRDAIFALILGTGLLVAATVCLILIITKVTDNLRGRAADPGTGAANPLSAQFTRT